VLTDDDLRAALGAIPIAAPVRAEEVTGSTNALAVALAGDDSPEWTLVSAGHQTDGRGRVGRSWTDVPDRALLFSLVLRPSLPPSRAGLLSLLAGACMADAIRDVTGRRVSCKWPNDILLDGAKVGGILLESGVEDGDLRYVVVGVGVNLEAPTDIEGAGAIGDRTGQRDASLPERVRHEWLPVSSTIGQVVRARTLDGKETTGRAVGIDDFGSLQLSTDTGEARVAFGDVEHLRPSA
jgi:BirA family transcriptional regulator, biotin operon repressor / biotin---[acetyl-CoA-carboxylase] ligase